MSRQAYIIGDKSTLRFLTPRSKTAKHIKRAALYSSEEVAITVLENLKGSFEQTDAVVNMSVHDVVEVADDAPYDLALVVLRPFVGHDNSEQACSYYVSDSHNRPDIESAKVYGTVRAARLAIPSAEQQGTHVRVVRFKIADWI